jgi:predicted ATPase
VCRPGSYRVRLPASLVVRGNWRRYTACSEPHALLTLMGAGGVGKTRLAMQVIAEHRSIHPGGSTAIIELATLADPVLGAKAVGFALGITDQPGRLWPDALAEVLRARQLLLVLDNCEHVISACAEIAELLLRSCPQISILATSREPLGSSGETTWRVPSLSLPEPLAKTTTELVAQYEAVHLFVERAAAASPGFIADEQNAPAIAQLCRQLDGIPLAIELAAACVRVLSVKQICERLDNALRLLTTGGRTSAPRQQTLRATLEWSYGLLAPAEQQLFDRLSVFAGGWPLEAAETVCAGDEIQSEAVLQLLARLVDKSLVVCDHRHDLPVRYRLLETLRQLGTEHVHRLGDARQLRDRHLDWFSVLAEQAAAELNTPSAMVRMVSAGVGQPPRSARLGHRK